MFPGFLGNPFGGGGRNPFAMMQQQSSDSNKVPDTSESIYISALALIKMLKVKYFI